MPVTERAFNPSGSESIDKIKEAALLFEDVIKHHAPDTRRRSIALTHLETAAMFAVKAVARGDD